ncbi:MAG TPA: hypothetical protein VGI12_15045 [Vicinamibacterales bacterium]
MTVFALGIPELQVSSSYLTAAAFTVMCATAWILIAVEFRRTRPAAQRAALPHVPRGPQDDPHHQRAA